MTNREWLLSLSDEDLSKFLTDGLCIKYFNFDSCYYVSIRQLSTRYTSSYKGLIKWLNEDKEFEVVKDEGDGIS